MLRTTLFTLAAMLTVVTMNAHSQPPPARPCEREVFRQFDFWIGTWEVMDRAGKDAGRNTISLEQNGCVLVERWRSASGGTGLSMNHYDPRSGQWKQHWVGLGLVVEMSGGFQDADARVARTARLAALRPVAEPRERHEVFEIRADIGHAAFATQIHQPGSSSQPVL